MYVQYASCVLFQTVSGYKDHALTSGELFQTLDMECASFLNHIGERKYMYMYMWTSIYNTHMHVGTCRFGFVCVEVMLSLPHRLLNHAHLANVQRAGLDKLLEEELKMVTQN